MIYLNGYLSLWGKTANGTLVEIETLKTPALENHYIIIKSIVHLSVWLNLELQSIINAQKKDSTHHTALLVIKDHLQKLKNLDDMPLEEHQVLDKLMKVVNKALFISDIKQIQCLQAQYLLEVRSINETYSSQATQLQLKGLHSLTMSWIKQQNMVPGNSRVLIVTSPGPRDRLIEKQYFVDLFLKEGIAEAEKGTGHIMCIEMLPEQIATVSQDSLIAFLQKHLLNMQIGKNMLGDINAMNKDILGEYAPPVLETLCPVHFDVDITNNLMKKEEELTLNESLKY